MDEESTSAGSSSDTELSDESSSDDQHYGKTETKAKLQNLFSRPVRMPYRLRKRLRNSMDGNETVLDGVCKQCNPAFAKIVEGFRKLVHQGSELKKRKKQYPAPKHEDRIHYCNVVAQNEWIRGNIFDAMGNYIFCHNCVRKGLGVSKQRLSSQA